MADQGSFAGGGEILRLGLEPKLPLRYARLYALIGGYFWHSGPKNMDRLFGLGPLAGAGIAGAPPTAVIAVIDPALIDQNVKASIRRQELTSYAPYDSRK